MPILPVYAHITKQVGNMKIEVGWSDEPPLTGQINNVIVAVNRTSAGGHESPVIDALADLDVKEKYGSITKSIDFIPSEQAEGLYESKTAYLLGLALRYFDEVSSDPYDIYDTAIKASQNNVTQSTTDLSDIYDATATKTNKLADVTINEQNDWPSDTSDISDTTTDLQFNSKQEPRKIFRLGRSDIGDANGVDKRGDIHYMREHLCRGETK